MWLCLSLTSGAVNTYVASEDSAMPVKRWVLIPLKGDEVLETIPLHRQEWYLFGKDRAIAHIPTDHPTCSRQHAVLQYRRRTTENEYGDRVTTVVPYVSVLFCARVKANVLQYANCTWRTDAGDGFGFGERDVSEQDPPRQDALCGVAPPRHAQVRRLLARLYIAARGPGENR